MPASTHGVAKQLDPLGEINRKIAALEKEVAQLRAARRLESATIGAGGLTITALGGLFVEDDFQNLLFALGGLTQPLTGGGNQYGLLLTRQNADGTAGQLALSMYTGDGTMPQTLGLHDAQGTTLWTDDGLAQQGIGRPYLSFPWAPYATTAWPSTTAGTWTNLLVAAPPKQQPKLVVGGAASTPSGVTGQLRLWDLINNVQLGSTVTITSQPAGLAFTIGPAAIAGNHLDTLNLALQAQVTAGTGAISATIYTTYGQQS